MKTVVIDYGMGNLGSVRRAIEECGGEPVVTSDPGQLDSAERILLPGVGAFGDGMRNLREAGWPAAIERALAKPNVAMLGICLGMQLLATTGYENGEAKGLGLIPGEVTRMEPSGDERLPHVGWNEIHVSNPSPLLEGIESGIDFYFVHSFRFVPDSKKSILATTPYGGDFVSIVQEKNVFGTQFHPEKSSHAGFRILKNFLTLPRLDA